MMNSKENKIEREREKGQGHGPNDDDSTKTKRKSQKVKKGGAIELVSIAQTWTESRGVQ